MRHSEKGVAMLMALVTMLILSVLAGELVYQSGVFSSVVFKERDRLRATLLARTGLRLALLQVRAAQKAKVKAKDMGLGESSTLTDKIWQTPMILPPPPIPGLSGIDQGTLDEFKKSLGLEGQVSINIVGSNDRMSINSLVWLEAGGKISGAEGTAAGNSATKGDVIDPNNPLGTPTTGTTKAGMTDEQKKEKMKKNREAFAEIFENILEKKRQNDDAFREKYSNLRGATLVGNLLAWMDPETKEDGENRGKYEYYSTLPTPYSLKDAPIATENEYPMIKGFDDTIAKLVAENFTVQNTGALDVNKATMLLISGLIPELNADALERIEKRRADISLGGEFKDADDFWKFVATLGSYEDAKKRFEERGYKILDKQTSYRVAITAESGMAKRSWLADIGPLPPADPSAAVSPTTTPTTQGLPPTNSQDASATKKTNTESNDIDSLNILYLRAD